MTLRNDLIKRAQKAIDRAPTPQPEAASYCFAMHAVDALGVVELVKALERIADYSPGSTVQPALIARAALSRVRGE